MKKVLDFFKSLLTACPYRILGSKFIEFVTGRKTVPKKCDSVELKYKNGIKVGLNITLIGFFCPIFWYFLISGANKDVILINALHSGIIMFLGLVTIIFNYSFLRTYRNRANDSEVADS